jgi:hypothetical protein
MAKCVEKKRRETRQQGLQRGAAIERLDRRNRPGGTVDDIRQGDRGGGHKPRLTHVF